MNALENSVWVCFVFRISFYVYQRLSLLIVPMTRIEVTAHANLWKVKDVA